MMFMIKLFFYHLPATIISEWAIILIDIIRFNYKQLLASRFICFSDSDNQNINYDNYAFSFPSSIDCIFIIFNSLQSRIYATEISKNIMINKCKHWTFYVVTRKLVFKIYYHK